MKARIIILAAVMAVLFLTGCSREEKADLPETEKTLFAMNTYMTLTAYGENGQAALDGAADLIEEVESLWSVTEETSEIYQANHSGGQTASLSDTTVDLLSFTLEMAEKTGGVLDPTIYPVLTAWGFTTDKKQVPSQEEIARLLEKVDYSRIQLEGNLLTVPEGMELDLGAVGKGYAGDLVAEKLKEYGIESAILSLGGNIQAVGSRPDGADWRIGIRAPWTESYLGILEISDAAVVTSGAYENYFEDEAGNLYWHILDPATGYPADSGLSSVTIIGEEGRMCDALSTALFVMGREGAARYWQDNPGFEMILVDNSGQVWVTEGLEGRFTLDENYGTRPMQVISRSRQQNGDNQYRHIDKYISICLFYILHSRMNLLKYYQKKRR